MSEPASISVGIAARYASAIFEIAKEDSNLEGLESGVDDLSSALAESEDLRTLISSPMISREEQGAAITAIADKMELASVLRKGLALMAQKRRLFVLPQLLAALRDKLAEHRGEVTAVVTSATALTDAQSEKLAAMLRESAGKDVTLKTTVDESLIGGMIVKLGSTMIDTSIKSKLASLQNAMKEVG
ncbi:F0F1 ATP synthase subunit delta [Marinibacterium sp. SX1]|uniref:F0F1 ATP synthase subunit delta n=1 Tax=Marinibacterium sp. SX1 TaxID=3388424 RepID=UPI003D16DA45